MSRKYYKVIKEFSDGIKNYHAKVGQILYTKPGDEGMYDKDGVHVTNKGSVNGDKCKRIKNYKDEKLKEEENFKMRIIRTEVQATPRIDLMQHKKYFWRVFQIVDGVDVTIRSGFENSFAIATTKAFHNAEVYTK